MKHVRPFALLAVFAAACSDPAAPRVAQDEVPDRPTFALSESDEAQPIPDQYIVVFRDDVADAPGLSRRLAASQGGQVRHTYQHTIKGFSARMSAQAAAALERNPNVAYVEQDQVATASETQASPVWGLDRIDQRERTPLNGFTYTSTGAGVTAYIIDTGIRVSHGEFGGRAVAGYTAFNDGNGSNDCDGHGTHVAGTVGGATYGVAKGVSLVAVRVLDCTGSGSWSGVIAGMDWATAHHQPGTPAVANLSLGGGASTAVDDAVRRMIGDGISTAVAAGNGNRGGKAQDACGYSPARVPAALTVGATTTTDAKTSWSNYGTCVDIFAPGSGIQSAWYTSDVATSTISGTSMASPHVAGVAALFLQLNKTASPATVASALIAAATPNKVTSAGTGSPNRLLYTSY